MNCQEFWNAMPQSADAAALTNQEHLAHCPNCAARLRNQLALKRGLRAVAGQLSRVEAPARVEANLRAAFRAHSGTEPGSSRSTRARAHWIPVLTWATAAAALLAVALFLVRGRQPEIVPPASHGVQLAMAGMPADIETEGGSQAGESGFIPLPNAAQIGPNEEVNLVRVEVPRSAMIALGYDIKPEEASQSVQADVMLGNDGLARAVRFLD
jgi:hypothetical protein